MGVGGRVRLSQTFVCNGKSGQRFAVFIKFKKKYKIHDFLRILKPWGLNSLSMIVSYIVLYSFIMPMQWVMTKCHQNH